MQHTNNDNKHDNGDKKDHNGKFMALNNINTPHLHIDFLTLRSSIFCWYSRSMLVASHPTYCKASAPMQWPRARTRTWQETNRSLALGSRPRSRQSQRAVAARGRGARGRGGARMSRGGPRAGGKEGHRGTRARRRWGVFGRVGGPRPPVGPSPRWDEQIGPKASSAWPSWSHTGGAFGREGAGPQLRLGGGGGGGGG